MLIAQKLFNHVDMKKNVEINNQHNKFSIEIELNFIQVFKDGSFPTTNLKTWSNTSKHKQKFFQMSLKIKRYVKFSVSNVNFLEMSRKQVECMRNFKKYPAGFNI